MILQIPDKGRRWLGPGSSGGSWETWSDSGLFRKQSQHNVLMGQMDVGCGRKRRVQNDYKVCDLSNWKNGAAISWKYRHGGGKVSPDHLEAKQAAKLTNGRGIQIQAV